MLDRRALGRHEPAIDERERLIHRDTRRGTGCARSLTGHTAIVARWRPGVNTPGSGR
jgi:hypothetical protein